MAVTPRAAGALVVELEGQHAGHRPLTAIENRSHGELTAGGYRILCNIAVRPYRTERPHRNPAGTAQGRDQRIGDEGQRPAPSSASTFTSVAVSARS